MRIFPILIAVFVSFLIYMFVFQRDTVMAAVGRSDSDEVSESATDTTSDTISGADNTDQEANPETSDKGVHVIAIHSLARTIDSAVKLRGQTAAFRQVDVRAETSGPVVSAPLRKGRFVEKGQLLCELDNANRNALLVEAEARLTEAKARVPEAEARVNEAQALLDEALLNDNAAKKLSKGGYASDTRVASTKAAVSSARAVLQAAMSGMDSTSAGIQAAQAAVEAAQKEIERVNITAPFDGLLESDTAELGSLLQPGALCATVIQLDPIILVGYVPETDVTRLEMGAAANAQLVSNDKVSGKVTFVSRSSDPETRTFRVEIEVPNPELTLRDGQTADITVAAAGSQAHLLPQSSLTLDDSGNLGVRIIDTDSTAKFMPVALVQDTGEGMWLSGLPDQADVIVIGQEYVVDGVPVIPSYEDLPQ